MKLNLGCSKDNHTMVLEFCSRLETDPRLFFGGYPTSQQVHELKEKGFRYIVDCTTAQEKKRLSVYDPKEVGLVYISFPIQDNCVPKETETFFEFIGWISYLIEHMEANEFMYIHCKGGHGRSGLICASLLCHIYGMSPAFSIQEVSWAHKNRPALAPKWKHRLCPSNEIQRIFVHKCFFKSIHKNLLPPLLSLKTNHRFKKIDYKI